MSKDKAKYSAASKARWANVSPEKRSEIMRKLAKKKQAMLSPEARKRHARKMVKARLSKISK